MHPDRPVRYLTHCVSVTFSVRTYDDPFSCVASGYLFSYIHSTSPAGIGAACAKALAEAGASLCLVLREPAEGADPNLATIHTLRALGAVAEYVFCDLSDLDAVKGLFQKALDKMGGQIHVLVNCAGIQRRSPSVDFSEGDWDDVSCSSTLA